MQVILLEKNEKLGNLGDIANVKSGYARNYLFPQGKAKPANKSNLAEFEKIRADLEAKEVAALSDAKAKESAMTDIVCTISANAGEEGKLYGSVSPADIVENLHSQGFKVEKRDIHMPEAIRHTGEYEIAVSIYAEVTVKVKVIILAATENE